MGSHNGLSKDQLGGVIFGAKKTTINECLYKNLFGLPSEHFEYVKKVQPGLPLFLFNYSDRTLLGIFEAVSSGQMNIDPSAWTSEGYRTPFPAQVQIRVKLQCKALTENQFKPLIINNYYTSNHFRFELDRDQTNYLLSLFASQALSCPPTTPAPHNTTNKPTVKVHLKSDETLTTNIKQVNTFNTITEKDVVCMRIKELALKRKLMVPSSPSDENNVSPTLVERPPLSSAVLNDITVKKKSPESYPLIAKLIEKLEESMKCKATQDMIHHLEQKINILEQDLAEAQAEIENLKDMRHKSELETCVRQQEYNDVKLNNISLPNDPILLVGGYDGVSWLASLDCYSPSHNLTKSLSSMNTKRCNAATTKLDGELYVFGGGTCGQWLDTVESYNPVDDRWTTCPPLNRKKGSLAGASMNDTIYAIGGRNGVDYYSTVEMLDFDVGAWIPSRSMLEKRSALAAAELNGAIYAVGGSDGEYYLRTTERFDPREGCWKKTRSMNTMRGCPSMVVLNEKLYVLGGYDGKTMVSTVEIYDPRRGSWVFGEPMNHPRGYSAAAVAKDSIYIIGGLNGSNEINDTVECYKEGRGWETISTNDAYRRCFFSAIAL